MRPVVVFACDGERQGGVGHVSRCLGLAEAVMEFGVRSVFAGAFDVVARKLLDAVDVDVICTGSIGEEEFLSEIHAIVIKYQVHCVLLDSYHVDADYVKGLREVVRPGRLVVIDDAGSLDYYDCDGVINFTLQASTYEYDIKEEKQFLGPSFFPARKWLREVRKERAAFSARSEGVAFVFVGGNDKSGATLNLTRAMAAAGGRHSILSILDRKSPDSAEIEEILEKAESVGTRIDLQENLREVFLQADYGLCGGGMVKYESCYAGIPVAVLSLTEIQAADTRAFADRGAVYELEGADQPSVLCESVSRFVEDGELRGGLCRSAQSLFPDDSAGNAARAILGLQTDE